MTTIMISLLVIGGIAAVATLDRRCYGIAGAGLGETGAGRPVATPGWAMAHMGGSNRERITSQGRSVARWRSCAEDD